MDKPDADIKEAGLIEWQGVLYEITAVRKSLNVLSVAMRQRTSQVLGTVSTATST